MKLRVALLSAAITFFAFFLPYATKAHAAWFVDDVNSFGQQLQTADKQNTLSSQGYGVSMLSTFMNGFGCFIAGCSSNPGHAFYYGKSAIAEVGNYMGAMYSHPPADTYAFVMDAGQSLGFVPKQAYAQGVGFSGLAPLLGVWKAFRNISYALLAFVMIIIGFMVMFRKKIDPKTVVSVQNALPRIIITLLLITFSYAIVGLLIDIMYLIILLAIAIIGSAGLTGIDVPGLQQLYTTGHTFDLMGRVFSSLNPLNASSSLVGGGLGASIGGGIGAFLGSAIPGLGTVIGLLAGAMVGGAASGSAAGFLSPFLFIFFAIALFFGFIRLLFVLISSYIQVILAVVLGPIQILLEAIPGNNGFAAWLTNLVANLAAFPITAILLVIGDVVGQNIKTSFWVPPLIPGASADIIRSIIGIGIILAIPNIIGAFKKSLKTQGAPVAFGLGGAGGASMQLLSLGVSIKQLGGGAIVNKVLGKKEKP